MTEQRAYYPPTTIEDPVERLQIMQDLQGFMPLSERELSEAFPLAAGGGTAMRRLGEVADHQHKTRTNHPSNAVRAITHEYIGNIRSSEAIGNQLNHLGRELSEPVSPREPVSELRGRGIRAIILYADLLDFRDGRVQASPLKREYFGAPSEYLAQRSGELKVSQARRLLPGAEIQYEKRRDFWRGQVESLQGHSVAGPIIKRAVRLKPL